MVDHQDKPVPSGVRAGAMTADDVTRCVLFSSGDCTAYESRMGRAGERTQYQCAKDRCGRP